MVRLSAILLLAALGGCTIQTIPQPGSPYYQPSYPMPSAPTPPSPGAIYNPATAKFLLDDSKARRVGDILLVKLTEATDASKNADTSLKKEDEVSLTNPTLFGRTPSALNGDYSLGLDIAPKRKFKGESDSKQSNKLQGTITVTVVNVLPNGYLEVRGEKWLTLNQGREYIRLSGIVRPEDIGADNSVLSTRVANANIEYSGTGPLAETNRQGWLSRFFSSSWWPF
ncbi:MAG: flagellar basal body L-ring protein FlgH [Gammaproteobacteria bacterium]|nr:MAG: flagellar basal body L-ring protein FlgH [Gammaproteobacteria bacterium]